MNKFWERITNKLISIFHLDKGNKVRNYGYFEGILSIIVNILLFILKFAFGTILNSISLVADAFHTLSDVVTSVLVVVGFKVAAKPSDPEHPFGHGRAERIFAIIIALILVFVGGEFLVSSCKRFIHPIPIKAGPLIIILLILSVLVKEFLTNVSLNLGKRINSSTLKADAWHHRSDSIATALVVVGFIAFNFGLFKLDGILGMAISILIAYTGISIVLEAGSSLMGEAPHPSLIEQIRQIALSCERVEDAHHIHVHDYGGNLEITVHIRLAGNMSLEDAHKKASEVEKTIKESLQPTDLLVHQAEITIHIEPEAEKDDSD